jgi:hypothetical protein
MKHAGVGEGSTRAQAEQPTSCTTAAASVCLQLPLRYLATQHPTASSFGVLLQRLTTEKAQKKRSCAGCVSHL